jgi:hypothetical protein
MKSTSFLMTGCILASMLAGSAFAQVYMTGEEVAKVVVGNTIEGRYRECGVGRNDFREYYDQEGLIHGAERACRMAGNWSKYSGHWEVKDGKFCVLLGSGRDGGCFDYTIDSKGTLYRYDEKGVSDVEFQIYDGNPNHL